MNSENKKPLSELINQMMEEPNHNPRDYCFRYIVDSYPKATHDAFDFPGEFVDTIQCEVFTDNGRNLKMDCAQLVTPKGNITRKSTINVEHQSYPIIKEKIGTIYDYKLYLIHKTNIPSNSIVMTNIDIGQDSILCESHDQVFKLHVKIVTEEEISKIEENLKKIKPVSSMIAEGLSPEQLIEGVLDGFELTAVTEVTPEYRCNCTRERIERALISVGREELEKILAEDGETELGCYFCGTNYHFSGEEIKEILEKI